MSNILISGGSGLVGRSLIHKLNDLNHTVSILSTRKNLSLDGAQVFHWNTASMTIDEKAVDGIDYLIHLAGAGVADKPWSDKRKKEIYDSRINSTKLLYNSISKASTKPKAIISASAIGIYKPNSGRVLTEEDKPDSSFLAQVCNDWEKEVHSFEELGVRQTILRTGIVLDQAGGAYKEMAKTMPFFAGALGGGNQTYSWIHMDDMVGMYLFALEKDLGGIYNAVAPNPVSQSMIAKAMVNGKAGLVMPVPRFAIKALLGEMSTVVLNSHNCSAEKIVKAGYNFVYPKIEGAIESLN